MRTVLKILAKGIGFCAVMLVLSILVCLAAGLVEFSGEETKVSEVPQVYVVEPQELEQDGEGEENPDSVQDAEEQEATLLFAGDLFLTDLLQSKYNQQGISAAASDSLLSVLREADIFMLNEEFPFGTTGEPMEEKEYTFRVDPSYSTVLSELGVDIVTLANNHMLDFGRGPLTETLNTLDQAGIAHVGAGENIDEAKALKTFEMDGRTIGFLGASRVIPEHSWNASSGSSGLFTTYDAAALVEQIQKAEESCDFTVVYVHWGIEKNTQPEEYQKTLARQYIDAGAEAVIGAHPHVLQGIDFYQGKPIFYSLGNFIFSNGAYETMLVELTVGGTETEIRLIPCVSEANQMRLLEESAWPAFYQNLESLSFGITIGDDGTVSQ